jgi:hypothetical protein
LEGVPPIHSSDAAADIGHDAVAEINVDAGSSHFDFQAYSRAPVPKLTEHSLSDDALKADIAQNKQLQPIIADSSRLIWVGWRRYLACRALNITPWIEITADGPAAALSDLLRREHSAIDQARMLQWLSTLPAVVAKFATKRGRINERLSEYLRTVIGISRNTSERHLASALRIADITTDEEAQIRSLKADGTINRVELALRRIRSQALTPQRSTQVPSSDLSEQILKGIDRLVSELRVLPSIDEHPSMRDRISALQYELSTRLEIAASAEIMTRHRDALSVFQPWDHQLSMCQEALAAFDKKVRTVAFVGPTGSGKTATGFMVCGIILENAERFMNKPRDAIRITWVSVTREQETQARRFNATFKMVPENNIIYVSAFQRTTSHCDILILDEDHRSAMPSLVRQYERSTPTIAVGLTATHYRLDRGALAFERVIKSPSINTLIAANVLAAFQHYIIPDFSSAAAAELYIASPEKWGPTLAFFTTIPEADDFVARLQRAGFNAETVTATSPRAAQISSFQNGTIAVLAAVGVLAEGFDAKALETVFVRDGSRGPVIQICGRALRKNGSKIAKIIQSKNTQFPFPKEARPQTSYLWEYGTWRLIVQNDNRERIPRMMSERKSKIKVVLPLYFNRRRKRQVVPIPPPQGNT